MDIIKSSKDGNLEIVKLLIEYDANVNIQDKFGETALMKVCKYSTDYIRFQIIILLLEVGADINNDEFKEFYNKQNKENQARTGII